MGTVVSFAVRLDAEPVPGGQTVVSDAIAEAVAVLRQVDERFSPYRAQSEVARIASGVLPLSGASTELTEVLRLSAQISDRTNGFFTTHPWDRFDPSGLVKGWAVDRAAALLVDRGFPNVCVSCGGDVRMHGWPEADRPWTVGITDPGRPQGVIATVLVSDGAVATSGTAERGLHVVDPHTGRPPSGLLSMTLVGADLTTVDACATAAFAMGPGGLAWVEAQPDLEGMSVGTDGQVQCTRGWPGTRPE